jgi:NAD(P)H dehydrogenase (quinone)
MRVLVVVAHPKSDSLTHALAAEFSRGLVTAGHEPVILDLYAAGFDPVVQAVELQGPPAQPVTPAVQDAQSLLRSVQGLALVYPVWWGTPPAMLQGWLQRVMTYGFAFRMADGRPQGLLRHKVQLILNAGGPEESQGSQYVEPLVNALKFCGMDDIKAHVNYWISPGASPAVAEQALKAAFAAGQVF